MWTRRISNPCWVITRWYLPGCIFCGAPGFEVSSHHKWVERVRTPWPWQGPDPCTSRGAAWRLAERGQWPLRLGHLSSLIATCFFVSAIYCMSQKVEKPVLSGQRIKTRKRGKRLFRFIQGDNIAWFVVTLAMKV